MRYARETKTTSFKRELGTDLWTVLRTDALPVITMKSLSTAPAPAYKFHRAQAICMKDKAKNDNYLGVAFPGEATGPDILLDAVQSDAPRY